MESATSLLPSRESDKPGNRGPSLSTRRHPERLWNRSGEVVRPGPAAGRPNPRATAAHPVAWSQAQGEGRRARGSGLLSEVVASVRQTTDMRGGDAWVLRQSGHSSLPRPKPGTRPPCPKAHPQRWGWGTAAGCYRNVTLIGKGSATAVTTPWNFSFVSLLLINCHKQIRLFCRKSTD